VRCVCEKGGGRGASMRPALVAVLVFVCGVVTETSGRSLRDNAAAQLHSERKATDQKSKADKAKYLHYDEKPPVPVQYAGKKLVTDLGENTKGQSVVIDHDTGNDIVRMKVLKPILKEGAFESLRDPMVAQGEKFPRGKDFDETPRVLSDMYNLDANPIATQHIVTLASEKLAELIIAQTKADAKRKMATAVDAQNKLNMAKKHYRAAIKRFSEEDKKAKAVPSPEETERHMKRIVVHSGYDPRSAHYLRVALEARNAWKPEFFMHLNQYKLNEVTTMPGVPEDVMTTFKEVWMRASKEGNAELKAANAKVAKATSDTAQKDQIESKKAAALELINFCKDVAGNADDSDSAAAEENLRDVSGVTLPSVAKSLIERFGAVASIPGLTSATRQVLSNAYDRATVAEQKGVSHKDAVEQINDVFEESGLTLMKLLEELLSDSGIEALTDMFVPETAEQLAEAWCNVKGGEGCAEFMAYRGKKGQPQQGGTPSLANIAADLVASHGAVSAIPGLSNSAKAALQDAWEKSGAAQNLLTAEERAAEAERVAAQAAADAAAAEALAQGKSKTEQEAIAAKARSQFADIDHADPLVMLEGHLEKIEGISSGFSACNHGVHAEVVAALAALKSVKEAMAAALGALDATRDKEHNEALELKNAESIIQDKENHHGMSQADESLIGGSPDDLMGPANVPIKFSGPTREEMIRRTMASVGSRR
jgi:hypothetical protein